MLKTRNRKDIFLDACIKAKQPFVVDNTNPSIEDRKKYIDIAKSAKFKVIGDSPCLHQNLSENPCKSGIFGVL